MEIREAEKSDLSRLLELYTQLHGNNMPEIDEPLKDVWDRILSDENHHIILGLIDGQVVSSCVIVIIPNLTHNRQPYALIENVITHEAHRNKGCATRLLHFAGEIAEKENCYKIMLCTGSKKESTIKFYENAGYNQNDKTAFIRWIE